MTNFHIKIEKPEEIIPRLGKQELHWKQGRSAYELATLWTRSAGLPASVRAVVEQADGWETPRLLEGIFERETPMPGRGRPSQTDLLAIVALAGGNAIIGVEGKVDEPFGSTVKKWLGEAPDTNRHLRLEGLCLTLGLDRLSVGSLYYQLLHRTCAAIYEAKRFGYSRAMMLVHSFAAVSAPTGFPACFPEFRDFAEAMGMPVAIPGSVSLPKECYGIEVRLAWVTDQPQEIVGL